MLSGGFCLLARIRGIFMKSKVYLVRLRNSEKVQVVGDKLKRLLEGSRVLDFIQLNNRVAVKMHFGEEGNTGFVKPQYLRIICDKITALKAAAFISDTNTLYRGRRTNSADHLALAREHGFTLQATGAEIIVPEDNKKDIIEVPIKQKFIQAAKLARLFVDADAPPHAKCNSPLSLVTAFVQLPASLASLYTKNVPVAFCASVAAGFP